MSRIVLMHPGEMGSSVGAALVAAGHEAVWIDQGRSAASRRRAEDARLAPMASLDAALTGADGVICVCPPEYAGNVAESVMETGYEGAYVDGNAVSPATALAIADVVGDAYVDGGIIGPPAWKPGVMRFYLSGALASDVAALFDDTLVDARVVDGGPGAASALKMCYAAYTKGSSALLLGVRALAARTGVDAALLAEWDISQPGLRERSAGTAKGTSPKAWRFEGEMREIAATYAAGSLPSGFHEAAAELYARMARFKDEEPADIESVIAALLDS